MVCRHCANLNLDTERICVFCGRDLYYTPAPKNRLGLAIASLGLGTVSAIVALVILSSLSTFYNPFFGTSRLALILFLLPASIVGTALGAKAVRYSYSAPAKPLAIAGMVSSISALAIFAFTFLISLF